MPGDIVIATLYTLYFTRRLLGIIISNSFTQSYEDKKEIVWYRRKSVLKIYSVHKEQTEYFGQMLSESTLISIQALIAFVIIVFKQNSLYPALWSYYEVVVEVAGGRFWTFDVFWGGPLACIRFWVRDFRLAAPCLYASPCLSLMHVDNPAGLAFG